MLCKRWVAPRGRKRRVQAGFGINRLIGERTLRNLRIRTGGVAMASLSEMTSFCAIVSRITRIMRHGFHTFHTLCVRYGSLKAAWIKGFPYLPYLPYLPARTHTRTCARARVRACVYTYLCMESMEGMEEAHQIRATYFHTSAIKYGRYGNG